MSQSSSTAVPTIEEVRASNAPRKAPARPRSLPPRSAPSAKASTESTAPQTPTSAVPPRVAARAQQIGVGAEVVELDEHTEKELARIRRERDQRARQYAAWDSLLESEAFEDYLIHRGLKIHTPPPMPYNGEIEGVVFGALFMLSLCPTKEDNELIAASMARLSPPMFTLTHRRIFEAISHLYYARMAGSSTPMDYVTVGLELKKRGETAIDNTYLSDCIDACPSAYNIDCYIDEVERLFVLRQLLAVCVRGRDAVLSPDADATLIKSALHNALQRLDEPTGRNGLDLDALFAPRK